MVPCVQAGHSACSSTNMANDAFLGCCGLQACPRAGLQPVELMSWIWEKSATWRWLVAVTKRSPAAMAAFTIGMCVVPYYGGKVVMSGTSMVTEQGTSLEQQLRARQTLEHKVRSIIAPWGLPRCSMR